MVALSDDAMTYQWFLNGDLLDDYNEITFFGTNHLTSDSDSDSLNDREEIYIYYTNPLLNDSDGDGYLDGEEIFLGTDPLEKSDNPGVQEASYFLTSVILAFSLSSLLVYKKKRRKEK